MKTNLPILWKRTLGSVLLLALAGCGSPREHNRSVAVLTPPPFLPESSADRSAQPRLGDSPAPVLAARVGTVLRRSRLWFGHGTNRPQSSRHGPDADPAPTLA